MKLKDVVVGSVYIARVSGTRVRVRIDADLGEDTHYSSGKRYHRGWTATNLATGRTVRIRSAQRLTALAPKAPVAPAAPVQLPALNTERKNLLSPAQAATLEGVMEAPALAPAPVAPKAPAALAPSLVPGLDQAVAAMEAGGLPAAPNAVGFMARIPGSRYYRAPPAGTPADVPGEAVMREVLEAAKAELRVVALRAKRVVTASVREGEHKGVRYTIGPRHPFPGIGWKIPTYDHLSRPTGYLESDGAFYDEVPEHPEGAYAWAEAAVRKFIDRTREG